MLNDLYEILKESLKKLLASRTFILGVFFVFLFGILAVQIFRLQIIEGGIPGKLHDQNKKDHHACGDPGQDL